jgi:uncharacterized membrane protein
MPSRLVYIIILVATIVWLSGIVAAPLLEESYASHVYSSYSGVCHQIKEHSFTIGGEPLAVCSRCTSVYSAFFIGVLLFPFIKARIPPFVRMRYYIFVLIIPMTIDVLLSWITSYSSTTLTRIITGGLFGLGASAMLIPLALEAFSTMTKMQKSSSKPVS